MPILKEKRYSNPSDVNMRLGGTVVRFQGDPFFVINTDGMNVVGYHLGVDESDTLTIHSSESDLDISSPPLGMTFIQEMGPCYVMRGPRRSQRQGLNPNHLLLYILNNRDLAQGFPFNNSENRRSLSRCITGVYQPFHALVANNKPGVFHRRWGLAKSSSNDCMLIFHKTRCVGFVNRKKKMVYIPKDFFSKTRMMELHDTIMHQGDYHVNEIA